MMDDFGELMAPGEDRRSRNLTDADIKALADELELRVVDRFYKNLGKGVWAFAWKAIVTVVLALIAIGSLKGGHAS